MRTTIALVAVMMLATAAVAQEKFEIKQKYVPGQYVVTVQQDIKTATSVGDSETAQVIKGNTEQSMWIQTDVSKPDDKGQQTVKMTYKRVLMESQTMGSTMKYDSADTNASASPLGALGAMVGKTITMTLDAEGKVLKVEGVDEMFDAIAKKEPSAAGMMDAMKKQFGPEAMKQLISASYEFLPDKPVAKGESWKKEIKMEMPMIGQATINTDNTLKEVKEVAGKKLAVIEFTGNMKSDKGQPVTAPNAQMTVSSMAIDQKGTVQIDVANPMIGTSDVDMTGKIDMTTTAGETSMPISIKMDGKVKTSTEPGVYKEPEPQTKPAKSSAQTDM